MVLAERYAEQARQGDGPVVRRVTPTAGGRVTELVPPGGAGGYQGTVHVVDSATGPDYLYYDLADD